MDSSTAAQCAALTTAFGGDLAVASATGSAAYERFTGNQIAKLQALHALLPGQVERISLVSSFAASLLLGRHAPIDLSDGSGMNLLDLHTRQWHPTALEACAPGHAAELAAALGEPVPSHTVLGPISEFWQQKAGFSPACQVVAWSGDNPCSLAGLRLAAPGDLAVSLGTSDTVFGVTTKPTPGLQGHIFVSPLDPGEFMAMVCFKNGSLTRERVRNEHSSGSWEAFEDLVGTAPVGNDGAIAIFFDEPEITPRTSGAGRFLFDGAGARVDSLPPAALCRGVLESQCLSLRLHSELLGLPRPRRLIATGGASANSTLTQVLADVFGVPVHVGARPDSASLGAAWRARHAWLRAEARAAAGGGVVAAGSAAPSVRPSPGAGADADGLSFEASLPESAWRVATTPRPDATAVYEAMLPRLERCLGAAVTACR